MDERTIIDNNTPTSSLTARSVGIRYGLFLAAISVVYYLVMNIMGVDLSQGPQRWAMSIVTIGVFVLAHKYFKENGDGFMSYGQGFSIGFWAGLISSVISAVFTYIYMTFIDTNLTTVIRDRAIEQMEQQGQSDEQIEMAMKFVDMFTSPFAISLMTIVFGLIGSIIIALLVSIFTKKDNPTPTF